LTDARAFYGSVKLILNSLKISEDSSDEDTGNT
jgi:hypothetical protein